MNSRQRAALIAASSVVFAALMALGASGATASDGDTASGSGLAKCSEKVCSYQTTSEFGSTTVRDLMAIGTPIEACPVAAEAYQDLNRNVDGFLGPCPSSEQIASATWMTPRDVLGEKRALLAKRTMSATRRDGSKTARRADLSCPPDCTGTPDSDHIVGDGSANEILGQGSADYIQALGGQDIARGEGGDGDAVFVNTGNLEIARGGDGDGDMVVTWADSGKDYAYGGNGSGDSCYVDGTDEIDSSCEWNNLTGGS